MARATAKLRSALKKINSLGNKLSRSNSALSAASSASGSPPSQQTTTVYVGLNRREYRVDPDLLEHPVMQKLVDRSDGSEEIWVSCEVVLFDHLRWMIENSDPQLEPLDAMFSLLACDRDSQWNNQFVGGDIVKEVLEWVMKLRAPQIRANKQMKPPN